MASTAATLNKAGVTDIQDALRLNLNWYSGGLERPGQLAAGQLQVDQADPHDVPRAHEPVLDRRLVDHLHRRGDRPP